VGGKSQKRRKYRGVRSDVSKRNCRGSCYIPTSLKWQSGEEKLEETKRGWGTSGHETWRQLTKPSEKEDTIISGTTLGGGGAVLRKKEKGTVKGKGRRKGE